MSFVSVFMDLMFPPKCAFCKKVLGKGDEGWCDICIEELPWTGDEGIFEGESFECCVSPLFYRGTVRRSILRFKFYGKAAYAGAYGKILADCIREKLGTGYDIITWVPLSNKRERTRGYDQAMLLALATALELDNVAVETLKKPHEVQAQSELGNKEERNANISGAYVVSEPELIEGKTVLLVDDVTTTGSTLSECAKELLSAGATRVVCATLACGD